MTFDEHSAERAAMRPLQSETQQSRATSTVKLHIERLVLHGFHAANRHHIADQVQAELQRLIAEGDVMRAVKHPIAIERTGTETISHHPNASPQDTGRQIAQAIYRNLETNTAPSSNIARANRVAPPAGGRL
jgi:hypothetical protein